MNLIAVNPAGYLDVNRLLIGVLTKKKLHKFFSTRHLKNSRVALDGFRTVMKPINGNVMHKRGIDSLLPTFK